MLLDANILLRLSDRADPKHTVTQQTIEQFKREGRTLSVVPQVIYEYWVVATRPVAENGLGMSGDDADVSIDDWITLFKLHRDERLIFQGWRELVRNFNVAGRAAHDARIVAAMKRHGITELLTFDVKDFQRYQGITILTPGIIDGDDS